MSLYKELLKLELEKEFHASFAKLTETNRESISEEYPNKKEILKKHISDSQWYSTICDVRIYKAMQEYSDQTNSSLLEQIESQQERIKELEKAMQRVLNICDIDLKNERDIYHLFSDLLTQQPTNK